MIGHHRGATSWGEKSATNNNGEVVVLGSDLLNIKRQFLSDRLWRAAGVGETAVCLL